MKIKTDKKKATNATNKRIISAPGPPTNANGKCAMTSLQATEGKPFLATLSALWVQHGAWELTSNQCPELTTKVWVRKLSSPLRRQNLVEMKSQFQQRLSDNSESWH